VVGRGNGAANVELSPSSRALHAQAATNGRGFMVREPNPMTADAILKQLQALGSDSYKRILFNHGIKEPVYGVKIEELKKIQKRVKKDYQLALALFDSGVYDAQYLAGLVADETKMTKKDLRNWLSKGNCLAVCGTQVAGVAAESKHGWDLAMEWIHSTKEPVAATGWETLSLLVAIKEDADLDLAKLKQLLKHVEKTIHDAPNRVRYSMNGFVISVAAYVKPLTQPAKGAAEKIGEVKVDMGKTACKVPFAPDYIKKIEKRGAIGKKRKTVRC
jgi:3-methyladenine DNA glycosylase AlkD